MGNASSGYSVSKEPGQKSLVMRRARRNTVFDSGMLSKKMTSTGSNLEKDAAASSKNLGNEQAADNQPDGPICHWLQHSTKIPVLGCDTCVLGGFDAAGVHNNFSCQDRAYFSFPKFDKRVKSSKKVQFPGYVMVLDGHGKDGEGVAAYCEKFVAKEIENAGRTLVKDASEEVVVGFVQKVFERCQQSMADCSDILPELSGTTASLAILTRQYLCTAGVGDSKGVLVCSNENRLSPIVLQEVHNLSSQDVKERIEKAGGRVEPMSNNNGRYIGPPRVWLKNSNSPGLVMSRSLGDTVAHKIGVTAEPEVYYRELDGTEMFLVLATDGVWEVMTVEEVTEFVGLILQARGVFGSPAKSKRRNGGRRGVASGNYENRCGELLAKEAQRRWLSLVLHDDVLVDDIAASVLVFKPKDD